MSPPAARPARGLLLACHPLPCVAVTAFAAAWAASVGLPAGRVALLAAAVLAGQLSVGWSNDALDAGRDARAGRTDKPVAGGLVARRTVAVAAGLALAACAGLSLALGVAPGVVHLVAVASAWLYNAPLKRTPASPLPYAVSFGLLVAVATLAAPQPAWPQAAVVLAAACLGVAAHFANTVGDTEADALTGVRGLPQRVGPRASLVVTAVAVALAAGLLLGADPDRGAGGTVLLVAGVLLAAGGVVLGARPVRGPAAFRLTLGAVGLVVLGFVT